MLLAKRFNDAVIIFNEMLYTINQVKNNTTGDCNIDLTGYAKKDELSALIDLDGLKTSISTKLPKTPQHTHIIKDIEQLQSVLNDKLDCKSKYSYKTILSDIEKLEYIDSPKLNELNVGYANSYKFSVSDSGDLVISFDNSTIASFNKSSKSWIFNGLNLNEFKNNVEAILKNHYDAIVALMPNYTDTTPDDKLIN